MLDKIPSSLLNQKKVIKLEANQSLFIQGAKPEWLYFLETGEVCLTRCGLAGESCTLQRIFRGFLAEASLFSEHYHCDAYCTQNSCLTAFPIEAFREQLGEDDFYQTWIQVLSKEIKRLRNQNERLSLKRAPDKVLHYLQSETESGLLKLEGSKKDWAAELGLSHESLYRTLKQLQQSGRITIDHTQPILHIQLTGKNT